MKENFFASSKRYLAVSLYGGYVNEYIVPTYKEAKVPGYQKDFTETFNINSELLGQINGWLNQAYECVKKGKSLHVD